MCFYEKLWLDQCPQEIKPLYYRRYVDAIFMLFSSKEKVQPFLMYLNSRHENINFSIEEENEGSLSLLDVNKFSRENMNFVTKIYCKP